MRFLGYICFLKGYKPENAIIIQPETMRNKEFTQDPKDSNKAISKQQIYVEQRIGGFKVWKIDFIPYNL